MDEAFESLREAGYRGWQRGLFSGFNGNMSLRLGDRALVTTSGSAKGWLAALDVVEVDIATGAATGPGRPSTETGLHLAVYRSQPRAAAVVHTHPPHLLAVSLAVGPEVLLGVELVEAGTLLARLGRVASLPPGSMELAEAVGLAARTAEAVFMERHGLACWGRTVAEALALGEEIEFVARVQWLALAARHGSL